MSDSIPLSSPNTNSTPITITSSSTPTQPEKCSQCGENNFFLLQGIWFCGVCGKNYRTEQNS